MSLKKKMNCSKKHLKVININQDQMKILQKKLVGNISMLEDYLEK